MRRINVMYDPTQEAFRSVGDMMSAIDSGNAQIISSHDLAASPPPSLIQKAANFATSAAKHVAAGMPKATQEQIDARFAICQGCEFFDGKACTKCGCPVVREKAFVSKLSWANEKCPAGKWGPVGGK